MLSAPEIHGNRHGRSQRLVDFFLKLSVFVRLVHFFQNHEDFGTDMVLSNYACVPHVGGRCHQLLHISVTGREE